MSKNEEKLFECTKHNTSFDKDQPCWACVNEGDANIRKPLEHERQRAKGLVEAIADHLSSHGESWDEDMVKRDWGIDLREALKAYKEQEGEK